MPDNDERHGGVAPAELIETLPDAGDGLFNTLTARERSINMFPKHGVNLTPGGTVQFAVVRFAQAAVGADRGALAEGDAGGIHGAPKVRAADEVDANTAEGVAEALGRHLTLVREGRVVPAGGDTGLVIGGGGVGHEVDFHTSIVTKEGGGFHIGGGGLYNGHKEARCPKH